MTNQKKNTTKKVLEKISKENIMPRARWHFLVHNRLLWASSILFLLVGAVAVSVMIFVVANGAWTVQREIGEGVLWHFLLLFPFLWLFVATAFVVICEKSIRKTKKGYRYSTFALAGAIIFASILLGFSLYAFGVSHTVDHAFGKHVPHYKNLEERRNHFFHAPKNGRISGVVVEKEEDVLTVSVPRTEEKWHVLRGSVRIQNGILSKFLRTSLSSGEKKVSSLWHARSEFFQSAVCHGGKKSALKSWKKEQRFTASQSMTQEKGKDIHVSMLKGERKKHCVRSKRVEIVGHSLRH